MRNCSQLNDAHMTPPSSPFPRRRESSQGACASTRIIGSNANFVRCLDSRLRGNDEI